MAQNRRWAERWHSILREVEKTGLVNVDELARTLNVSEATVRRDLYRMDREGLIRRVHGGAVMRDRGAAELPLIERSTLRQEAKRAIGKAAAALVNSGETVFIGSGTTALAVAEALVERTELKEVTIITNSIPVAVTVTRAPHLGLIVVGGFLRREEQSLIGFLAEQTFRELRADKVIMGVGAIHLEHGLTNRHVVEMHTDRTIMDLAPEVIVVADHSKFGTVATARLAGLDKVSTIVTDSGLPEAEAAKYEALGIRVLRS
ncbi:MAG: DeoR/GlpR family DNA-binding transcription regulator [Bacillota bacterium]|nr:DeoR/GlpR family DNA-binding transcription regulator [Bacillota bacterium]